MVDELEIRPVRPSDEPRLADLFLACFRTSLSSDYFAWKYRSNPGGKVIGFVADAGTGLAAFYGVIPEPWKVGGADATVYQSMDTMTHPDFQRRGLFGRLAELTYEELQRRAGRCDLVGIPGPNSYPGLTGRLRWTEVYEFSPILLPAALARLRLPGRASQVTVEAIAAPDSRVHEVLSRAAAPLGDAWPDLQGEFFDWRVFGRSPKKFCTALASLDGSPIAVCVYSLAGGRAIQVSYLAGVAGVDEHVWFRPLLRFAARSGGVMYTWRPRREPLASLYRSAGFRGNPLRRGPLSLRWPLCVRSDTGCVNGVPWDASTMFDLQPLMHD